MINIHKKLLGEVPTTYNGGGKSGGGATYTPEPITTSTVVGDQLSAQGATFSQDEENSKREAVKKATKGTRGLQIPMSDGTKATQPKTAATSGVQL